MNETNTLPTSFRWSRLLVSVAFGGLLQAGCQQHESSPSDKVNLAAEATNSIQSLPLPKDLTRMVLISQRGDTALDEQIRAAQQAARTAAVPELAFEKLGWLFVAKARVSFDSGYYNLAAQCATVMESTQSPSAPALLLRGHVLHNLHQFSAATPIARFLVSLRGSPMDFGLLGDVLLEQGQLDDAIQAYQQMMDLRPDSRANARAAHVRWLKGDVSGAAEAMSEAAGSVGQRDPEAAAWMNTRLAHYQFQLGQFAAAKNSCATALALQSNYPPALLLHGRALLVDGNKIEAVRVLTVAAQLNPLPEYDWALDEALVAAGDQDASNLVRARLARRGPTDDPRTYAIYLATKHQKPELAVRLARLELKERADVTTYDALAWAEFSAGDFAAAEQNIVRARAEGTQDGRLFLHSALIAARAGDQAAAKDFLKKSYALKHLLWPSERKHLQETMTALAWQPTPAAVATAQNQFSSSDQ